MREKLLFSWGGGKRVRGWGKTTENVSDDGTRRRVSDFLVVNAKKKIFIKSMLIVLYLHCDVLLSHHFLFAICNSQALSIRCIHLHFYHQKQNVYFVLVIFFFCLYSLAA